MSEQALQLSEKMNDFEADSNWFYKSMGLLREKGFVGQFVAVKKREVIASGKDFSLVVKEVESRGENPAYIMIEFVYPEETVILL